MVYVAIFISISIGNGNKNEKIRGKDNKINFVICLLLRGCWGALGFLQIILIQIECFWGLSVMGTSTTTPQGRI